MKTIKKKRTSFRLRNDLIAKIKNAAKKENCSMNSYVEHVLMEYLYFIPNAETTQAIEDAKAGIYAGTIDTSSKENFLKSVLE